MIASCTTPADVLGSYDSHDATLWGLLASRARRGGERALLVFAGRTLSFDEALERAEGMARSLASRGVVTGDRVAIMAVNSDTYVLLLFALARLGTIAVPVNPELNAAEAGYIFGHAGVAMVVCDGDRVATVEAAAQGLARAPLLVRIIPTADAGADLEFAAAPATTSALPREKSSPDDTWLMLYTSGTTGFPKGVMHSQRSFVVAGEAFVERMYLQPEDRLLVVLPLFHINALFYSLGGALAAGASLVLVPRFRASAFWRVAADAGATEVNIIGAVGNILTRRARSEFVPGHRLRKVYGAGMSAETLDVFSREFGVETLVEGYGLTEVPGVCNWPFTGPQKRGSIGRPALHPDHGRTFSEVRIVDEAGGDVPIGATGEIAVRSPITMQGYYRDTEATSAAFREGWFLTGDLGRRDADGFYYFVARKKDIIRRRGENVSGAEIDRVVAAHPKVLEAAAIAVPGELGDDEIFVVVVPRPGRVLTPDEIVDWCAEHLAPCKRPRYFLQTESLPHTPTHRVAKFKLKQDPTLFPRAVELRAGA